MKKSGQLTVDELILLNQLALGIVSRAEGDAWFRERSVRKQRAALRGLTGLIVQDSPHRASLNEQLARMTRLPPVELPRVFQLLMKLLAVADRRRRLGCGQGSLQATGSILSGMFVNR